MAIKSTTSVVIDDTRKIFTPGESIWGYPAGMFAKFSDFHPKTVATVSTDINFATSNVQKKTLTGNTTFTISNATVGRTVLLVIDTSTSGYTPTFPSTVKFPTTPTWSNNRHWHVHLSVVGSEVRATAVGFDEPGSASSTFNDWTFNNSWDTTQNGYGTFSQPWAAVWVSFQHQTSNNRIAVVHGAGNFNTGSNQYTSYATYTGLSNITSVTAQYTVQSQSVTGSNTNPSGGYSYGPLPTNDGFSSGSYYTVPTSGSLFFGWQAVSQSGDPQSTQTSANFSGPNVDFRIKIVDSVEGTLYATSDIGGFGAITATSNWGNTPAF